MAANNAAPGTSQATTNHQYAATTFLIVIVIVLRQWHGMQQAVRERYDLAHRMPN